MAAVIQTCETAGHTERDLIRQLQVDRWPACHSLFLNVQQLLEDYQATAAESTKIRLAGDKLSLLHCLHIIGRAGVLPTEDSFEGLLVSTLARHASVLTLQLRTLKMPLTLPNLQHLVLDLGRDMLEISFSSLQIHEEVFPSINMLKGLKTLFIQASRFDVEPPSLTNCVCLRHVAMRGVNFVLLNSSPKLALPAGCQLHAILGDKVAWGFSNDTPE